MKYAELVDMAKRAYASMPGQMGSWGISRAARTLVKSLDLAEFIFDNEEMIREMIDRGVGIKLDETDYQQREIEVSLEDVMRELLEEKLWAVLQSEWDSARQLERAQA